MPEWWRRFWLRANVAMGADLSPGTNLAFTAVSFALTAVATAAHAQPLTSMAMTALSNIPAVAAYFVAHRRNNYNQPTMRGMLKYLRALAVFIMIIAILAIIGFKSA